MDIERIQLFVNMELVTEDTSIRDSYDSSGGFDGFYRLDATEARTYTVHAVVIDNYGNSAVDIVRVKVD